MNSLLTEIADGVVEVLNAATLSQAFGAERRRRVEFDRSTAGTTLAVYVFGLAEESGNASREIQQRDYTVVVAIYKQVETDAEADAIDYFRQQVFDLLSKTSIDTSDGEAGVAGIANDPVYDPPQLDKFNTFATRISATYRLLRQPA